MPDPYAGLKEKLKNYKPPDFIDKFPQGGFIPLPGQREMTEIEAIKKRLTVIEKKLNDMPVTSKILYIPTSEEVKVYGKHN